MPNYVLKIVIEGEDRASGPLKSVGGALGEIGKIAAGVSLGNMLSQGVGALAGMAKGDIPYDEAKAVTAASNIEALTHYDLPGLFVEGSGVGQTKVENAAKPVIWEKMEDFRAKFAGLGEAAAGSAEAVKGGAESVGPVVVKIGAACKACHDVYREKS